MKTGVIDVGGGLRGIYAAGVFDYCLEHGITFDYGIGISAGSANLASSLAGQKGRNYDFYTDYAFRKEYMGLWDFLHKGTYIDLDYVYGTLSNSDGERPLNYQTLSANPMEWYIAATDSKTGEAVYFSHDDIAQNDYSICKASSALPFVCKPYEVRGRQYFDGALGNPVPVQKAFDDGCDRVVLILTKPENILRSSRADELVASQIHKKYPNAARMLRAKAERYNEGVMLAQAYAGKGRALIVAPDNTCGVETLTRDKLALHNLYKKGFEDGAKILEFLGKENQS